MDKNTKKAKREPDNCFWKQTVISIADGYCSINLTRNIVSGVMHQVIDGVDYDLNNQLGMPENSSFTELVALWAQTVPEEGRSQFLKILDRDCILERFHNGEQHISFTYWTRTATYEPMLAEDHMAIFEDEETGDILAINYVLDRTEQYQLTRYKEELEQKNRQLETLLEAEKKYNTKLYHDALTGAYNRRYYEEVVRNSIGPAGVALMDVDDFKICNDTYGHHAGDLSLEVVAAAIRSCYCIADRLMYQTKEKKDSVVIYDDGKDPFLPHVMAEQSKQQILIVDDAQMNRELLSVILENEYRILEADNGKDCLEKLYDHRGDIALVLLDINMPVMDGFEVLKDMNDNHTIEDIPVIMISSDDSDAFIRKAYELGASDYISRPFDSRIVYRRATNTIKLYAKQRRLVQMVSSQIQQKEHNTAMLVSVLSQIVEFRNGESGSHVRHIRIITEKLLNRLLTFTDQYRISQEEQEDIALASCLHDIGKIVVDEKILNKPGKLTKEEFEVMKTHSMCGAEMIKKLDNYEQEPLLQTAYEITRWHHERWDGHGYPDGLRGNEIPISAQIVSVADVYDALTSERCYKKAFSHEKAINMIRNGECGIFNPMLLQCLVDIEDELRSELKSNYHSY